MPNYTTHAKFNILLALPVLTAALFFFLHPSRIELGIFVGLFVYGTLFMNPDLDLANKIKLFSLRGLLSLPFRSYSLIFRHRGLSHTPLLGTLTRVAWLGGFLLLALYLIDKPLPSQNALLFLIKTPFFLYGIAAIALADWCHILLDLNH